jgi:hypothetical protein
VSILDTPIMDSDTAPAEKEQTERDALAELVESDGWKLFLDHVETVWGAQAVMQQIDHTIVAGKGDPVEHEIREIAAAARQIQVLAKWPGQRLSELKAKSRSKPGMFAHLRRA